MISSLGAQRVIRECFVRSRPVYIFFPSDMVDLQVPLSLLQKKIDLSLPIYSAAQDNAVSAIVKRFSEAQNPSIFVDALVLRHGVVEEVRELVDALKIPVYYAMMGKHIVEDAHKCMVGLYNGVHQLVWRCRSVSDK